MPANWTAVLSLTWFGLSACSEPNAANLVIVQSPDLKGSATREDKIALDLRAGEALDLHTPCKSGDVEVTVYAGSKLDQGWSLHSGYGSVSLILPDGCDCSLEASTGHGEIQTDFPLQMEAGKVKPQQLRGSIGKGSGTVRLDTASGNIAIRKAR